MGAGDLCAAAIPTCKELFRLAGNDDETGTRRGVSKNDSFFRGAVAGSVREKWESS